LSEYFVIAFKSLLKNFNFLESSIYLGSKKIFNSFHVPLSTQNGLEIDLIADSKELTI